MVHLGFVHTAVAHVSTFDALVAAEAEGVRTTHVVDPELLRVAQRAGSSKAVRRALGGRLVELQQAGVDAVVCTCSTLGPAAEQLGGALPFRVMRVDRAMAELATRGGSRIAVVAALQSTVAPTVALLQECAGGTAEITLEICDDAWAAFVAGEQGQYLAQVAGAARRVARDVDVVVLAQASMAPAADTLGDLGVQVLASPRLAVRAALDAAQAG